MIEISKTSVWRPNYVAENILAIDTAVLQARGISHLVFDIDNTLVKRRSNQISEEYVRFMRSLQAVGMTILIGSNRRRDISWLVSQLKLASVQAAGVSIKPFGSFYRRLLQSANTTPSHIVMVGDHILNDIIGANNAGFTTILVEPFNNKPSLLLAMYLHWAQKH